MWFPFANKLVLEDEGARAVGTLYRQVEVLVFFAVSGEAGSENLSHLTEQQRGWEANERSARLERWRLVIGLPPEQIARIPEIATMPHVNNLQLDVHLTGLFVPERKLSDRGWPRGDRAYLLPKSYWGEKTPRLLGYVSSLSIEQHVSCGA